MFCVVVLLFSSLSLCNAEQLKKYFILIDAGSSGSRVHVHPYLETLPVPIIDPSFTLKKGPGLSSFATHPEDAGASLVPLLEFAIINIPTEFIPITPIHLQATAGLRSIDPLVAEKILESCRDVISKYPFRFQRNWATIISGVQEGLNGWIATNYLKGHFSDDKHGVGTTVGVLEMGGASMQLTFVPDVLRDPPSTTTHSLIPLKIGEDVFHVYTYSYLNYGLEKAQEWFEREYKHLFPLEGNPCYPIKTFQTASGNWEACQKQIMDMLETVSSNCSHGSCGLAGIWQPLIDNEDFYAIENFFYTTEFFGIDKHPEFALQLKAKGTAFCSTPWEDLKLAYPKEPVKDLEKYCFSSAYMFSVLRYLGFKFNNPQQRTDIAKKINGVSIDWALGAVLHALVLHDMVGSASTGMDLFSREGQMLFGGVCVVFLIGLCYNFRRAGKPRPIKNYDV